MTILVKQGDSPSSRFTQRNIFSFHSSRDAQAVACGCCAWISNWSVKDTGIVSLRYPYNPSSPLANCSPMSHVPVPVPGCPVISTYCLPPCLISFSSLEIPDGTLAFRPPVSVKDLRQTLYLFLEYSPFTWVQALSRSSTAIFYPVFSPCFLRNGFLPKGKITLPVGAVKILLSFVDIRAADRTLTDHFPCFLEPSPFRFRYFPAHRKNLTD